MHVHPVKIHKSTNPTVIPVHSPKASIPSQSTRTYEQRKRKVPWSEEVLKTCSSELYRGAALASIPFLWQKTALPAGLQKPKAGCTIYVACWGPDGIL
eukprot:1160389-Pelagomonas_calceolata.AAC.10